MSSTDSTNDTTEELIAWEHFIEAQEKLQTHINEQLKNIDHWLLTLSGGFLSIIFAAHLIQNDPPASSSVATIAKLLVASIAIAMLSKGVAYESGKHYLKHLVSCYKNPQTYRASLPTFLHYRTYSIIIMSLNIISYCTFLSACFILLASSTFSSTPSQPIDVQEPERLTTQETQNE